MTLVPRFAPGAVLLLLASALAGCQHAPHVHTITQADNGGTVSLSNHDRLQVELPGNPSTGFSWQSVKLNSWVLAPVGRPSFQPEVSGTNAASVGGAGTLRLTYEAVGPGSSPLELSYTRPWEPEAVPAQVFKISVNVSR